MNESSPIKRDTAREYPVFTPAPVRRRRRIGRWLLVLLALGFAGAIGHRYYDSKKDAAGQASQANAPGAGGRGGKHGEQAQAVGIATVASGEMPVVLQGLGTVTPLATVTVRSQISGYLTEIGYREGQTVKKGDFLVQIDARPYEALLAQNLGQLARDQALLQNAKLDLTRYQTLNRQDSISKQNVDTQAALVKQNEGTVAADQAMVDQQRLNIAYARIVSPVEGRVGLRQVDLGNYVSGGSQNIVVVTQLHPISVLFTLPEDDVSRVMKRVREGAKLTVRAYDRGDQHEIATGTLDTVDNQIDVTTGTVKLRAMFANDDESLFPNQFVNAKLTVDTVRNAPIVPTAAILRGTPGTYVYLIQAKDNASQEQDKASSGLDKAAQGQDKVSVRPITVGETDGPRTVVLSGLQPGDRVVTDGTDRLREGASVRIIEGTGGLQAAGGQGRPIDNGAPGASASTQAEAGSASTPGVGGAPDGKGEATEPQAGDSARKRGRDRRKAAQ